MRAQSHKRYNHPLYSNNGDVVMSECWCDCGGKMTEYSANVKVCQECKKIPNLDTLLDLLREMGAQEETIKNLKQDLNYVPV